MQTTIEAPTRGPAATRRNFHRPQAPATTARAISLRHSLDYRHKAHRGYLIIIQIIPGKDFHETTDAATASTPPPTPPPCTVDARAVSREPRAALLIRGCFLYFLAHSPIPVTGGSSHDVTRAMVIPDEGERESAAARALQDSKTRGRGEGASTAMLQTRCSVAPILTISVI